MKRPLLFAAVVLLLDQATKILVERVMFLGHTLPLLPWFSLTHVQNTGSAFGLFPRSNGLFIGLTLLILVLLATMHREMASQGAWARRALPLVWAGALGNLVDRIRRGAVTDFLDVHWRGWHWPAFNVADSAITVGVAFLMIQHFSSKPRDS